MILQKYLIRPKSSEAVEKLLLAQKAPAMSTVNFRQDEEEICERLKIVEEDAKAAEEEQGSLNLFSTNFMNFILKFWQF